MWLCPQCVHVVYGVKTFNPCLQAQFPNQNQIRIKSIINNWAQNSVLNVKSFYTFLLLPQVKLSFGKTQEWKKKQFNTKNHERKTRRNSRGKNKGQSFLFTGHINSHKHTVGDTHIIHACMHTHTHTHKQIDTRTHVHTHTVPHPCLLIQSGPGIGWQSGGLHHHQNKSNSKDPSSHLDRQTSQPIRSGAADCWAESRHPEFTLLGWIPIDILLRPSEYVELNNNKKEGCFTYIVVSCLWVQNVEIIENVSYGINTSGLSLLMSYFVF